MISMKKRKGGGGGGKEGKAKFGRPTMIRAPGLIGVFARDVVYNALPPMAEVAVG